MSIKIWYQTEEQEFLHAEMQHYFEAVLQMQAEKASEQDADLKVIVEKEDTDMDHICIELHGGKGKIQASGSTDCRVSSFP
jgi:hypothetical protein